MDPYLTSFMTRVIEDRITSGKRRQDILQILIDSQKAESVEDRLAIAEMINEVTLYLVAGSETSSNTIGFTFVELLKNPETMTKLQQEIDELEIEDEQKLFQHSQLKRLPYLNAVISETMRLYPVATAGLQRKTYTDTVLAGKLAVPKNVNKTLCVYFFEFQRC
jgi:cytochrome P450